MIDGSGLVIRKRRDGSALIQSRTAIPGLCTADPRDRRRRGVKIARFSIGGQEIALDHEWLTEGWHAREPDGRWTSGAAMVPACLARGGKISVMLAATLSYPPATRRIDDAGSA